jgi:hypothetical protein
MFRFTTRDWFWLCVVMALAIGWGTHVRYTASMESPKPYYSSPAEERLRDALEMASDDLSRLRREVDAFWCAIGSAGLTKDQKDRIEAELKTCRSKVPADPNY